MFKGNQGLRWYRRVMTPPTLTPVDESIVATHSPYGVSTGFMWDQRGDWKEQVSLASRFSSSAVELSALSEDEVEPLLSFLENGASLPFRFQSVHGPAKNRVLEEPELVDLLRAFDGLCDGVVMHPDTMLDVPAYRLLGRTLIVENLDARKGSGGTVEDLTTIFDALPEARFCFDVAHAWSLDPAMDLAEDLLDAFAPRLSHVHISSLDENLHHVSLTPTDEALFTPVLKRCQDVPWILEAPPPILQ